MQEFTFAVLAFNHQNYITEHLESIKYLIRHFGADIQIDLIINDDCSQDQTVEYIDQWLRANGNLFRTITRIYRTNNCGTCSAVTNVLNEVKTKAYKITAGDDVYSCENIFQHGNLDEDVSILSGVPLEIRDSVICINKIELLTIYLSQFIYEKRPYIDRFIGLSNNNAPNIFYCAYILNNKKYQETIRQYDVIEDWPTQIFLAENFPRTKFQLINKVFVYYRRTAGSTYLVANKRFVRDKILVYDYLIKHTESSVRRLLLRNRRFLFLLNSRHANKALNISFYIFIIRSLRYYRRATKQLSQLNSSLYKQHYANIVNSTKEFRENQSLRHE